MPYLSMNLKFPLLHKIDPQDSGWSCFSLVKSDKIASIDDVAIVGYIDTRKTI